MSKRLIMVDANAYDDASSKVLRDLQIVSRAAGNGENITDLILTISECALDLVRELLFDDLKNTKEEKSYE